MKSLSSLMTSKDRTGASVQCELVGEVPVVQDTLPLLLLPMSCIEPSLVLVLLPPRLYASLWLLSMPQSLGLHVVVMVAVTAAMVDNASNLTVIACWFAINAGIRVVMLDVGNLCFQTHHWVYIIITYSGDIGFFWCLAAIWVGFCCVYFVIF